MMRRCSEGFGAQGLAQYWRRAVCPSGSVRHPRRISSAVHPSAAQLAACAASFAGTSTSPSSDAPSSLASERVRLLGEPLGESSICVSTASENSSSEDLEGDTADTSDTIGAGAHLLDAAAVVSLGLCPSCSLRCTTGWAAIVFWLPERADSAFLSTCFARAGGCLRRTTVVHCCVDSGTCSGTALTARSLRDSSQPGTDVALAETFTVAGEDDVTELM